MKKQIRKKKITVKDYIYRSLITSPKDGFLRRGIHPRRVINKSKGANGNRSRPLLMLFQSFFSLITLSFCFISSFAFSCRKLPQR